MEKIQSGNQLYEHIGKMSKKNSVTQIYIPGKGTFKILFQEEDPPSILSEAESNFQLRQMIKDSRVAYKAGDRINTEQFLATISPTDFAKQVDTGTVPVSVEKEPGDCSLTEPTTVP